MFFQVVKHALLGQTLQRTMGAVVLFPLRRVSVLNVLVSVPFTIEDPVALRAGILRGRFFLQGYIHLFDFDFQFQIFR